MWMASALVLVGALFALLFVPADVSFEMERIRTLRVVLGVSWWFIRVRRPLNTGTSREKRRSQERAPRPHGTIPFRTFAEVAEVPGLWKGIRRFLVRLARSVRILNLVGRIRLGTGDPSDTGRLWAIVWPVALWSSRWPRIDLGVEPDFFGAGLTGTLGGTVRLYPARLAYSVGSTAFSPTTIRLVMTLLRSRPWRR